MQLNGSPGIDGQEALEYMRRAEGELIEYLQALILAESPTTVPASQAGVRALLIEGLEAAGMCVRFVPGRTTGGLLYASPISRRRHLPLQMILGHMDTVWPLGTLREMPLEIEDGMIRGPGSFDMKVGLAQAVFALRALKDLGATPSVVPVVLFTSDEEIGSPESERNIVRLAKRVSRTFVLEPSLGPTGRLKTRRKGIGRFDIRVIGVSAHGGLDPYSGASAILELSHVIQKLHALGDRERGITVNVGVVEGGLRANVIAPSSRAEVDVRVWTADDARRIENAIHGLEPTVPGTRLEVEGSVGRQPMERTPRNTALWEAARELALGLGIQLEEGESGGGSDGNLTSQYTATLDGLGAVGDGAHARHEFAYIDPILERAALLTRLLAMPPLPSSPAD
jgi:glutamate carboxypeptidase